MANEDLAKRHRRILVLTERGVSAADIAKTMGLHIGSVYRIRGRYGVARTPPRRFDASELARAEQMLEDGASIADIARTLGRDPATVNKRFRGRGWTRQQIAEYATAVRLARQVLDGF